MSHRDIIPPVANNEGGNKRIKGFSPKLRFPDYSRIIWSGWQQKKRPEIVFAIPMIT